MTLYQAMGEESRGARRRILAAASLAAIANTLILFVIKTITSALQSGQPGRSISLQQLIGFAALVALYVLSTRLTNQVTVVLVESLLYRIKVRVGDTVARVNLAALERVKAAELCDRITENMTTISERASVLGSLVQSIVTLGFLGIYISTLSVPAVALVTLVCGAGMTMFVSVRRSFVTQEQESAGIRLEFREGLSDLLSGFKEVTLSRRRNRELRAHIVQSSAALRDVGIQANNFLADGTVIGEGVLFILLAALAFALRFYVQIEDTALIQLVTAAVLLWAPFRSLCAGIVPYLRSNLALAQIEELEQKLTAVAGRSRPSAAAGVDAAEGTSDPWGGSFERIEARGIEYEYPTIPGGEQFGIGPLDLTIQAGEILFIIGGNGSGKSTFLKVLTGLYTATGGELLVDGVAVTPDNAPALRDMISAIFSDFHLFQKLYGVGDVDDATVQNLLVRMQLANKTSVVNGSFTKLALSTGQKKRLAMIVALLEDRPICVFDEWAADQDPEFRQYFYEELLPLLRQKGKTLLVVSHDDRYFRCADRVVTMDYGKIRSIEVHRPPEEDR